MAKQKDLSSESKATLLWNSGSSDAESTPVASSSLAGRSLPRFEKVSWRTREGISTMASASSSSTRRAGGTTVFVIAGQNLPVAPHTYIRKSSSAAPQTLPVSADPVFACAGMLLTTARVVSAESKARRGQAAREVVSSARARMTNFPGEARTCMRTCCIHCSGGFAGASRNAAGPAVACVASMLSFHTTLTCPLLAKSTTREIYGHFRSESKPFSAFVVQTRVSFRMTFRMTDTGIYRHS